MLVLKEHVHINCMPYSYSLPKNIIVHYENVSVKLEYFEDCVFFFS